MAHFPVRSALLMALVVALATVSMPYTTPVCFAKEKPGVQLPARNFLPPVANINDKIYESTDTGLGEPVEPVEFNLVGMASPTTAKVKLSERIERRDTDLGIGGTGEDRKTFEGLQQQLDEEDLKTLWDATVEKNPVIRFSLEKLTSPEELHIKQSSQFSKKLTKYVVDGAVMGLSFAPSLLPGGAGDYQQMTAYALRNAARNMLDNGQTPPDQLLTATEKIELANLIHELKQTLIENYRDYRTSLEALSAARQNTARKSTLYSKALQSDNRMAILAAGTNYYKAMLYETELRQKAKGYRLQLERLAGQPAVESLRLSVAFQPIAAAPLTQTAQGSPKKTAAKQPVKSDKTRP